MQAIFIEISGHCEELALQPASEREADKQIVRQRSSEMSAS